MLYSFFYRAVPAAVFSQPPIGGVGLTEEQVNDLWQAKSIEINDLLNILMNYTNYDLLTFWLFAQAVEQYGDIDVYTANFRPLKATLSGLPDRVFMKLIVSAKTNEVLGLHMCGDDAPEIVQVFVFTAVFILLR